MNKISNYIQNITISPTSSSDKQKLTIKTTQNAEIEILAKEKLGDVKNFFNNLAKALNLHHWTKINILEEQKVKTYFVKSKELSQKLKALGLKEDIKSSKGIFIQKEKVNREMAKKSAIFESPLKFDPMKKEYYKDRITKQIPAEHKKIMNEIAEIRREYLSPVKKEQILEIYNNDPRIIERKNQNLYQENGEEERDIFDNYRISEQRKDPRMISLLQKDEDLSKEEHEIAEVYGDKTSFFQEECLKDPVFVTESKKLWNKFLLAVNSKKFNVSTLYLDNLMNDIYILTITQWKKSGKTIETPGADDWMPVMVSSLLSLKKGEVNKIERGLDTLKKFYEKASGSATLEIKLFIEDQIDRINMYKNYFNLEDLKKKK